ncbi:hypothetical protein [Aliarcobacter cryaerophilus]|uniref:hypothetical protein n=1 Tax=Aliarcobacter cryaerophilus TaxID=28198 RepID=UPI003DA526EE
MDLKNNIISMDYFKANMEEIEKLKDKNLLSSILSLAKFQTGNLIIDDSNLSKIDAISPHTVFAFNTALIKDLALSYEDLEKSIKTVYQSFENSE